MDLKQLRDLRDLANAGFERDSRDLREAVAREVDLRAELSALDESEARRAIALQGDLEIAFAQTGEALWQNWADRKRKELLARLAHQLALKEVIKTRARKSFGRKSALADLESAARQRANEEVGRRETQDLIELEVTKGWMTPPGTTPRTK